MAFSSLLAAATCPVPDLPCAAGTGLEGFGLTLQSLIPYAAGAFYAILFLMLMIYALNLIINSSNEAAIDEARKAFMFALFGSAVVWFRLAIVDTFQINGGALVDATGIMPLANSILSYAKILGSAAALGFVIVRGIRLATAGGDEGALQTQRKLFLNAIFGVGILVLAGSIVDASFPGGSGILASETLGILSYLTLILGGLVVLSIVIGAAMLILSYNDSVKERAQKAIFASVIVLIVLGAIGAILSIL